MAGSVPHGWSTATVDRAPYLVTLFAGLLVSAWGMWRGNSYARILLLALLTIAVALSIKDVWLGWWMISGQASRDSEEWRSAAEWSITTELVLLSWLVLNYWYLLGIRARQFFGSK